MSPGQQDPKTWAQNLTSQRSEEDAKTWRLRKRRQAAARPPLHHGLHETAVALDLSTEREAQAIRHKEAGHFHLQASEADACGVISCVHGPGPDAGAMFHRSSTLETLEKRSSSPDAGGGSLVGNPQPNKGIDYQEPVLGKGCEWFFFG
ncbi:hypothetical protein FALCPG4_19060 [Fusarium falciforme]